MTALGIGANLGEVTSDYYYNTKNKGGRPYVFRSYFDTQLLIAESRGKIAHDFRAFFMGHKGSIEAKYTTNKGVLPEALINEMREAFKRSEEFLDLEGR